MRFTIPLLAAAGVVSAGLYETIEKREDTWGGSVSLGPTKSTITNAVTTLIPGAAPPTQNGVLFLWPGMSNGTGDLVQTTLESWADNSWCGASSGQWCVRASLFGSFGQLDGDSSAVSGTDQVRIEYNLESDGQTWKQYVWQENRGSHKLTGTGPSPTARLVIFFLPSLTLPDLTCAGTFFHEEIAGIMLTSNRYGTGTECNDGCTGTVAAQKYKDTVITLAEADTTFGSTISKAAGATYSGLTSSQGGKVWTIAEINIPAMQ
ncbi:unnamed protein product [Penicillium olsonii]|uniref:Uncharacterized protein n=1 Tax=Penicillium olsonii TaxID=99116 RepID=A0A9W4HAU6_PENOL|nr:unnamed protein product [Penicillium olsonii]CAG8004195.1 unnamed protein product [Penicillium olsonii]